MTTDLAFSSFQPLLVWKNSEVVVLIAPHTVTRDGRVLLMLLLLMFMLGRKEHTASKVLRTATW